MDGNICLSLYITFCFAGGGAEGCSAASLWRPSAAVSAAPNRTTAPPTAPPAGPAAAAAPQSSASPGPSWRASSTPGATPPASNPPASFQNTRPVHLQDRHAVGEVFITCHNAEVHGFWHAPSAGCTLLKSWLWPTSLGHWNP